MFNYKKKCKFICKLKIKIVKLSKYLLLLHTFDTTVRHKTHFAQFCLSAMSQFCGRSKP